MSSGASWSALCRSGYGFAKAVLISACGSLRFIKQTLHSTGGLIINLLNFSLSPLSAAQFLRVPRPQFNSSTNSQSIETYRFPFRAFLLSAIEQVNARNSDRKSIIFHPSLGRLMCKMRMPTFVEPKRKRKHGKEARKRAFDVYSSHNIAILSVTRDHLVISERKQERNSNLI